MRIQKGRVRLNQGRTMISKSMMGVIGHLSTATAVAIVLLPSAASANQSWRQICADEGRQAFAGCVLRDGRRLAFCLPLGQTIAAEYTGVLRRVPGMTYRITSRGGRIALRHPSGRFRSPIRLRQQRFVRGQRTELIFRRGTYTYRYELGVFGGRDAGNSFHGVTVLRNGQRIGRLQCSARARPAAGPRRSFTIVPGQRFGPITRRTTLRDLRRIYGRRNVWVGTVNLPHGDFGAVRGAIVFRGTPREIKVVFKGRNRGPEHIVVDRRNSRWRTTSGIGIGTGLRRLERIIGSPFQISGFGQDGGGSVNSRAAPVRDLYIRLQGQNYSRRMNRPFRSNHPHARRSRLRVSVIWWQIP